MRLRALLSVEALSGRRILLLGVAIAGCASGNRRPPLSIRVVGDTVPLLRSSGGASLKASAVIHNNADRAVYYGGLCGTSLQRQTATGWLSVWANQLGVAVLPEPFRIAPGDSLTVGAGFVGSAYSLPAVDARVGAGVYRLVFDLAFRMDPKTWAMRDYPPGDQRASTPFIVVEKSVQP